MARPSTSQQRTSCTGAITRGPATGFLIVEAPASGMSHCCPWSPGNCGMFAGSGPNFEATTVYLSSGWPVGLAAPDTSSNSEGAA